MNVLFLGNGYDLNYKLPTSYRSFLLTVDFLLKHSLNSVNNIGDVFGNCDLTKQDKFIQESYMLYKDTYDSVVLDGEILKQIIEKTRNNIWFNYFIKSFNKDVGWIDFEKEIAFIIKSFQIFFSKADVVFIPKRIFEDKGSKYVIMEMFNFFIEKEEFSRSLSPGARRVLSEYTIEYPLKSDNYIINKEKIINFLIEHLNDLIDVLKLYFQSFIDNSTKLLFKQSKISQLKVMEHNDIVVSFNYTNTYELFQPSAKIFHVHGNINDKIVLGVNSDESDEENSVDISFIGFKKYYQRTYYGTDISYLRWLRELFDDSGGGEDIHLLVMGHSLDVTDKDYISELFSMSSKIIILYHNDSAKSQYIKNLIKIFGIRRFEEFRDEHQLGFLCLNSDLSEFCAARAKNSSLSYAERFLDVGNMLVI